MAGMVHEHANNRERTYFLAKYFGQLERIVLVVVQLLEAVQWLLGLGVLFLK